MPPLDANLVRASLEACGHRAGEPVALGVSGGGDSMAALILLSEVVPVTALTVDHGLRAEAREEAELVAEFCKTRGIDHHILTWQGDKPRANIQALARAARYQLLERWCHDNGCRFLVTAHHRDDQAETFLLRLARGSGVKGLASIGPRSSGLYHPDIIIARPFLNVSKTDLLTILEARGITSLEDASNRNTAFDRVKARAFLKNPPLDGLASDRLAKTADRMARANQALDFYRDQWLAAHASIDTYGAVSFDQFAVGELPDEVAFRALADIIRLASGSLYTPRFDKLRALAEKLRSDRFSGATLSGAEFLTATGGRILVCRELAALDPVRVPLEDGLVWDNRFRVDITGSDNNMSAYEVGALGVKGWRTLVAAVPKFRDIDVRKKVVYSLPTIYRGEDPVAVPLLGVNLDCNPLDDFSVKMSLLARRIPKK